MGSPEEFPIPEDDLTRLQDESTKGIVNNPRNSIVNPFTHGAHGRRDQDRYSYRRQCDQEQDVAPLGEIMATYSVDGQSEAYAFTPEFDSTKLIKYDDPRNNRVVHTTFKVITRNGTQSRVPDNVRTLTIFPDDFAELESRHFSLSYTPDNLNVSEEIPFIHEGNRYNLRKSNTTLKEFRERQYNHFVVDVDDEKVPIFHPEPIDIFGLLRACEFPRDYSATAVDAEIVRAYRQAQQKRQTQEAELDRLVQREISGFDQALAIMLKNDKSA